MSYGPSACVVVVADVVRTNWGNRERFNQESLTTFYTILQTSNPLDLQNGHFVWVPPKTIESTGYDVTMYFRSEVIDFRKRANNNASDGFNLESPKLAHTSTPTSGYDVTDYFRLAVIEVQKRSKIVWLCTSHQKRSKALAPQICWIRRR